jgi:hypothetical protein
MSCPFSVTEMTFHVFSSRAALDRSESAGPSGYFLHPVSTVKVTVKPKAKEKNRLHFFIFVTSEFNVLTPHD